MLTLTEDERQRSRNTIGQADANFVQRGIDTCKLRLSEAEVDIQAASAAIALAHPADRFNRGEAERRLQAAKEIKIRSEFYLGLYQERKAALLDRPTQASKPKAERSYRSEMKEAISAALRKKKSNYLDIAKWIDTNRAYMEPPSYIADTGERSIVIAVRDAYARQRFQADIDKVKNNR